MKNWNEIPIVPAAVASTIVILLLGPQPGVGQAPLDDNARAAAAAALAIANFDAQAGVLTVYDRQGGIVRTGGERGVYAWPSLSSDGKRLAVSKRDEATQNTDIWVFDLSNGRSTRITPDRARVHTTPVWSPDGLQIAHASNPDGSPGLYRRAADGTGNAELLYQHPSEPNLTDWSADGRFLTFYDATSLYVLPLTGPGERKAIEVLPREFLARGGRFSPDGRFLAYVATLAERPEIWVRRVDPSTPAGAAPAAGPWQISDQGGGGMISWRHDGKELYYLATDQRVMVVEISTVSAFTSRRPRPLFKAPDGISGTISGTSVSGDGQQFLFNVVPKRRGTPFPRQLTVFDRQGNVVRTLGEAHAGDRPINAYTQPMLSPDGTQVAAFLNGDIRVFDVTTGRSRRVTSSSGLARYQESPVWSPDGRDIAFFSFRNDWGGLYRKASDGTGSEELLYRHTLGVDIPLTDWSSDGRFLAFSAGGVLWTVPVNGESKAVELMREEFQVFGARFSPDGRFLAYASDESGRNEVYVRPFDPSGGLLKGEKWQVSKEGGLGLVQWRRDGRELYYLAADGSMMAVDVTTTPTFSAGLQRRLFRVPSTFELEGVFERGGTNALECSCAVAGCEQGSISRDGQRFVFAVPLPPERTPVALAPAILAQYTGTYAETQRLLLDWVVTLEGDQLMIQRTGREKAPLFAESETRFFLKASNADFEFKRNEKGDVKYLFLYRGGGPTQSIRQ